MYTMSSLKTKTTSTSTAGTRDSKLIFIASKERKENTFYTTTAVYFSNKRTVFAS